MKVTEEMVERAKRARVHTLAMAWEKAERIVLEAALADVPEPVVYRGELRRAEARIAATDGELIAEMEACANDAAIPRNEQAIYLVCARMLRDRKVKP